jgi:hypothetical protein
MNVWSDFNGLIELFLNSVSRIRRVDEIVMPSLKLKKNTLRNPDLNNNSELKYLVHRI